MNISLNRLNIGVGLLALALAGALAGHFPGVGRWVDLPPYAITGAALASTLLIWVSRARRATRLPLVASALLLFGAGIHLHFAERDPRHLETKWKREESNRIASILLAVGERIHDLESLSASIGEKIEAFLTANGGEAYADSLGRRLEAFQALETLAAQITRSGKLPAGTVIGVQLFDGTGRQIAWAGWPQLLSPLDRKYLLSGEELVYSRQVSLYRILSHIIPIRAPDGAMRATLLVDLPLEVNYRVNNKFLKSTGLANDLASAFSANIRLDYYPTTINLPELIDGYKEQLKELEQKRAKSRKSVGRSDRSYRGKRDDTPGQRSTEDAQAASMDSVLTYAGFPAFIEPIGDISGEKASGLNGRVLIRSLLGNPLLNISVHGRPFKHFSESLEHRRELSARILELLSFLVLFVFLFNRFPARFSGPLNSVKVLCLIGFLIVLRYCLLSFQPESASPLRLFSPVIFATPLLGGLMRNAVDLLITAVFAIVAIYGTLKITRDAALRRESSAPSQVRWLYLLKGAIAAGSMVAVFVLGRAFVKIVVVNANPRLLGEAMGMFELQVLILHLSIFLIMAGIFLAGATCVWGASRVRGGKDAVRATVLAGLIILVASVATFRIEMAVILLPLLLFIVLAPRLAHREDLVSIVIVAFCFVIIVSGAAYVFLNQEYQALRRTFIEEKVTELTQPSDNWKVFILEDVLESFSGHAAARDALVRPGSNNVQRLAFDLWAESPLSLLGYSTAIYVFDREDSLVSKFTVEMPYRARFSGKSERLETPTAQQWVVLDLTRNTPEGIVRFYRGIVNLEDYFASRLGENRLPIGKIVVDVPFFFESLAWAARTGPQTPEVLRNVQEGGIEPRLEEPEALLLARLKSHRVIESSSDALPVGIILSPDPVRKAKNLKWPLLTTGGRTYRVMIAESQEAGSGLLAGFRVSSPVEHLLQWSTILSLYFFFTVAVLSLIILSKYLPILRRLLPTLTPGRQLGFQQKLLVSFLVVAVLPAIILGVFSAGVIKGRFVAENEKEAINKATSARKSLANLLNEGLTHHLNQFETRDLVSRSRFKHPLYDGNLLIQVFTTPGGGVVEDAKRVRPEGSKVPSQARGEGAPPPGADRGARTSAERALETLPEEFRGISPGDVFVRWTAGQPYVGVLSHPIATAGNDRGETGVMYYGRKLDGELLGEIAEQIGADVNVYDGGQLVASSQEGLLSGGFISSIMSADAFVKVSLMGVERSIATEKAGRYSFQVAYVPLQSARGEEDAALGLPLLFRPESYHLEIEKATSVVLSLFALLFAATIGLGLILARGIFEPLKDLLEGTKRISRGDLSFRLPSKRRDEIGTVVEAFNDMTDQLSRSQAALEERRRYLEVILVNIGTGVISTDADDRIRTMNNAAERILGIGPPQVLGKTFDEAAADRRASQFFSILKKHSATALPFMSSEVDITTDGKRRTIKYMQTRLTTDGRYIGTVYVFEDLTELINSKKLSAWVEMARQIAHEIKNPLTPIKLSAQFMLKAHEQHSRDFDRILKEGSDTIIQQVDVLKRIASEFSSFGRLQQLEVVPRKIFPVLEDIVSPYRKNAAGVDVKLECPNPNLRAMTDTEAFRKVCSNLLENAMEAMPGGGELQITCDEAVWEGQRCVRVAIRDSGPGLEKEVKEKLFEPYFSTKTMGTGLGLAICRTLSREMGGDVTVENVSNGHGVEATVYLKLA